MEQLIFTTVDWVQKIGMTGLLIILAIPKLKKRVFGNENGYQEQVQQQINELHKHAETSNFEVGKIKEDIAIIRTDIGWIRDEINKN